MPLSIGMRHARVASSVLSPASRQSISTIPPPRSLHALRLPPFRPTIAHPRSYGRISALLNRSFWKAVEEQGSHTNRHSADAQAPDPTVLPTVLRPVGGTSAAISGAVFRELMRKFIDRVDELDPAPAQYSIDWWLRLPYERQPRRCFLLVVPDERSRKAAREALEAVCKRWHGWVGALRSSYVCIVLPRKAFDDVRDNLQYNDELGFKGEARVYCAVGSRYEMDPISAPPKLKTYIEASENNKDKGEKRRLLLHSNAKESIDIDHRTVDVQEYSGETTAASSSTKDLDSNQGSLAWLLPKSVPGCAVIIAGTAFLTYFATRATYGCNELRGGSDCEQEQHHGESHNRGKSKQTSALDVQHGAIKAAGDVDASTHIHHGCEANPLSSSSPTVGNNQPNGNEGLTQKQ